MPELHEKYAPILRFNRDETFFPMRVEDMLRYSGLYRKGADQPLLPPGEATPDALVRHGRSSDTFLRSVTSGPLRAAEVIADWSSGALEMVYRWSASQRRTLAERLAQRAYDWFSPKTAAAAQLFWWNGLVQQALDEALETAPHGSLPRLILPSQTESSALAHYQAHKPPPAYYYRQVVDAGYLCLQYWFFYSYNNWGTRFAGMNDHEGDWEGMMLFFQLDALNRPQEPPAFITFADHESRQTKPWEHPDVQRFGTHPVGFAAAGSHATYPQASTHSLLKLYNLFDFATGDGRTIDHDAWVHRINLDDAPWIGAYQGSYGTRFWLPTARARSALQLMLAGTPFHALARLVVPDEIELPGVSAPRGPVSPNRPQYASPAAWAGVPPEPAP